jgi:hypothetical protein
MKSNRRGQLPVLKDVPRAHFVELDLYEAWKATGRFTMKSRDLVNNFLLHLGGNSANWRYTLIKWHAAPLSSSSLDR